jgi:hypothetical protein
MLLQSIENDNLRTGGAQCLNISIVMVKQESNVWIPHIVCPQTIDGTHGRPSRDGMREAIGAIRHG